MFVAEVICNSRNKTRVNNSDQGSMFSVGRRNLHSEFVNNNYINNVHDRIFKEKFRSLQINKWQLIGI